MIRKSATSITAKEGTEVIDLTSDTEEQAESSLCDEHSSIIEIDSLFYNKVRNSFRIM